ncbi:Tudor/PWWP/MBT superfamily protein [Abeliophyllum distichum]|uniref:Tudor/PWWP/MBT superfamily protein n=1 Tax=Abeliophyllum distichum TaxID=126358 RepID=A0ABD1RWY7_9LAMI
MAASASSYHDTQMGSIVATGSSPEEELNRRLIEAGNELLKPHSSTKNLLEKLDKLQCLVSSVEQKQRKLVEEALQPSKEALIASDLLRHTEMDVKVTVASCIAEIIRISAPDVPYDDEHMKEYFQLAIMAFGNLSSEAGRCYANACLILLNTAYCQSFVVMLDLQLDELVLEMFRKFLSVIRPRHPTVVFECMEKIMNRVIENYEELSLELLSLLLATVKKENCNISPISFKLGRKVFENCAGILKPYLPEIVRSLGINLEDYSDIVASLCKGATQRDNADTDEEGNAVCLGPSSDGISKLVVKRHTCYTNSDEIFSENPVTTSLCCDQINQQKNTVEKIDFKPGPDADGSGIFVPLMDERSESQVNWNTSQMSNTKITTTEPLHQEINQEEVPIPKKRNRKPNSLMKPDEGYDPLWIYGGRIFFEESSRRKHNKKKTGHPLETTISKELHTSSEPVGDFETLKAPISQNHSIPSLKHPKKCRRKIKDISVDRDDGLYLLSMSASNLCKTVTSKDTGVVESSKEKLENGTESSLRACKGDEMNKYSEKRTGSSVTKITTTKKNRGKTVIPEDITRDINVKTLASHPTTKSLREETHFGEVSNTQHQQKNAPFNEEVSNANHAMRYYGEELVGSKIKVLWPMDEKYYEGTVESFDRSGRKHKVAYDDGDEEILDLTKEFWQLIGNSNSSIHEQKTIPGPSASTDRSSNYVIKSSRPSKRKRKVRSQNAFIQHIMKFFHKSTIVTGRLLKVKLYLLSAFRFCAA